MSQAAEIKLRSHFDAATGKSFLRFDVTVFEATDEALTPLYQKQLTLLKTSNGLVSLPDLCTALKILADAISSK